MHSSKIYTVLPNTPPSRHTYDTVAAAVEAAEIGSVIVLGSGDHTIDRLQLKPALHFYGMPGSRVNLSSIDESIDARCTAEICTACPDIDIIFENVTFVNVNNDSLNFGGNIRYLFRNCRFIVTINGGLLNRRDAGIKFGFHLLGGSATLHNPVFCFDVTDLDVFIAIGADDGAAFLSLQSPTIRLQYKDVRKIETYFFRGVTASNCIPYFEAFASSIHLQTDTTSKGEYDGHCCRRQCKKRHCDKKCNRKCKQVHICCNKKKCRKQNAEPTNARLFRSLDCVQASLNSTKIYFIEGKGLFNIGSGDAPIYINALTAAATNGNSWEIGEFRNILLTSFMSNLQAACEIEECHCIKDCPPPCSDDESFDSEDECSCKPPCHPPFPPCPQPCPPFPPCPQPCPPFPCPPGPCPELIPCPPFHQPCPPGPCPPGPCPELIPCPPFQQPCPPGPCPPFQQPSPYPVILPCGKAGKCKSKSRKNSEPDDSARFY